MAGNTFHTFSYDDAITITDDRQQVLHPDGTYEFTVGARQFGEYVPGPNGKLPPCDKVSYPLTITSPAGTGTVWYNMYLIQEQAWKILQFFRGIGLMTEVHEGDSVTFDWDAAEGRTGRCEIGHHEHNGTTYNDVAKILPYEAPEAGGFNE